MNNELGAKRAWFWGGRVTYSNGEAPYGLESWAGAAATDTAGPHPAAGRC